MIHSLKTKKCLTSSIAKWDLFDILELLNLHKVSSVNRVDGTKLTNHI